jgi:hypothetical protein
MNTLVFHNPGEIDIRGACIAGLSAKEGDSPIGYFGTGLKYSIACILRWGGKITIYSGTTEYKFKLGEIEFRGAAFKIVYMNDEPLGFTTEYGKNWEPWQVFRELYANARDEGGDVELYCNDLQVAEGRTAIFVSGPPDMIEAFHNRNEIILPINMRWDHETDKIKFTARQAVGIYYRGVRVHEQPCLYTWNFLQQIQLTEDRTLLSVIGLSYRFYHFLEQDLHDIDIIIKLLSSKLSDFEPKLLKTIERDGAPVTLESRPVECIFMDCYSVPQVAYSWHSDEFKEACKRLYQRDPTTFVKLRPFVKSIDSKLVEDKAYILNHREQQMFDKAKQLVSMFGFESEIANLPIIVQELGGNTLGLYESSTIYLSPKLFDQGTKQLVATLYEECYHHRTQKVDCTYNMQSDLFNIIVSLNEELHGVIC